MRLLLITFKFKDIFKIKFKFMVILNVINTFFGLNDLYYVTYI